MSLAAPKHYSDTIFALATARGRSGVSVMRLSGPQVLQIVQDLSGKRPLQPRRASLRTLTYNDTVIDEAIVIYFPAPHSFTGEDVIEIQGHGSLAVIQSLSATLLAHGLRQAEAGEFTRRAVENGRMDLTEAEGLLDLIDAESEAQRRQALRQMGGALRDQYTYWRETLLDALASVEGEIDFADEGDVPDALSHAAYAPLTDIVEEMGKALDRVDRGQAVRNGIDIAIIGAPNAGKSTLLNSIIGRDIAITSPQAGTTRDIVSANMVIAGLPVTVLDTAGLRETDDQIEAEGVRRARQAADRSHLTIHLQRAGEDPVTPDPDHIHLWNVSHDPGIGDVNALTGEGIDKLMSKLEMRIKMTFLNGEPASLTRARHRDCVDRAMFHVKHARHNLGIAPEFVSEDIRCALSALDELAGRSDIEEVFDRIFSQFCVGK